jgi:pimeloyl-ACP methyl ester carboxylesterase
MASGDVVVSLHTRVWNPGAAHRALLLHGLGSDGATMWRLADHLACHDYEVTAPDLRGMGVSPPANSYALANLAADVRRLGGGWDLLVGHSLGGAVGAMLLAEQGFAARGLLLDPVIVVPERDKPKLTATLLAEVGDALTLGSVRAQHPKWDDEDIFRLVRASAMVSPHVVHRVFSDTATWDLVVFAARWRDPVTILAADPQMHAMFTPAHVDRVRAACPHARIVTVPQAGHSVHRDAPETVLAAIDHLIADTGSAELTPS